MIRAFLFDFDGVILDTENLSIQIYERMYRKYGLAFSPDKLLKFIGTDGNFQPIKDIEKVDPNVTPQELRAYYVSQSAEGVKKLKLMPGVQSLLDYARQNQIRVGIASSSPRKWLDEAAASKNILSQFDIIITADQVQHVKPDPEIFITAMNALKVKPEESIIFEDSQNGLKAAKTAGAFCVTIDGPYKEFFDYSASDLHLTSLAEISPDLLIKKVVQK